MSKNERLILDRSKIECVMHKDIEEDAVITELSIMKLSSFKNFCFWLLVLSTGGIFFLVSYWFPNLRIKISYTECSVEEGTKVKIASKYFNIFTKLFRIHSKRLGELIVFKYQELAYYYDGSKFQPLYFETNMPNKRLIETYSQGYGSEQEIIEQRELYGMCLILVPVMPLFKMTVKELTNPFYIFQVYSVILWYFESYYAYAVAIVIITLISLVSTITTTRRGLIALHNLARKEVSITVVRKGKPQQLSSTELVPGDLVEVSQEMELPCDLCLISGGCIVEEGMLTGESVPVLKDALPFLDEYIYDPDFDKRHTLYEGTKVIQTRNYSGSSVQAVVVRTGFTTVKGRLIRSIMYPKPNKFKFYEDSMKFILFLSCLTLVGFVISIPRMLYLEYSDNTIALRLLDLITITVPPALPACMAAGVAFAVNRLRNQKIYCIAPDRVNVAGKIDICVFDKTGTLTEDGMNLLGVQGVENSAMKPMSDSPKKENELILECMAACHSLAMVDGKLIGDTQDVRIFKSTGWVYDEPESEKYDPIVKAVVRPEGKFEPLSSLTSEGQPLQIVPKVYELGILHIFHFTSKLKRMAVIVKNLENGQMRIYTKGAPEVLLQKCTNVPKDLSGILSNYTRKGYRVLACAYKNLENMKYTQIKSTKIEDFEENLNFIGLIILQNKLKEQTIPSLNKLRKACIRTVMATGDAVLTGISVARECNLVGASETVFFGELQNEEIV